MGDDTGIQWTDATWNPVRGCTRVSDGCRNCYAEAQALRMSGPGQAYEGLVVHQRGKRVRWTGEVREVPALLDQPLRWRRPRRIFVNSMSDLFHEKVPPHFLQDCFATMGAAIRHTFQVLTKRPQRMLDVLGAPSWPAHMQEDYGLSEWPLPNVWLGVSVEDQETADERIPLLLETPAAVRFVSYEPALGPVDFSRWLRQPTVGSCTAGMTDKTREAVAEMARSLQRQHGLHWIIVGGESGPGARPFDVTWARSTVEQCRAAGVAVFCKQLGAHPYEAHSEMDFCCADASEHPGKHPLYRLDQEDGIYRPLRDRKGGDWSEWPEDIRVREFPA